MMKKASFVFLAFLFSLFLSITVGHATTYYVDFDGGNDSNSGRSQTAPWKTIPGTRVGNGSSAFLHDAWGTGSTAITTSNRIQPGDIIKLKSGTTYATATSGSDIKGCIHIYGYDSGHQTGSFYEMGTLGGNPITIQVDPSWGNGSPVTFNAYDSNWTTSDGTDALILVIGVKTGIVFDGSGITSGGQSAAGIIVKNSPVAGIRIRDYDFPVLDPQIGGFTFRWLNVKGNGWNVSGDAATAVGQLYIWSSRNVIIEHCTFDGTLEGRLSLLGESVTPLNGVFFGDTNDKNLNVTVTDSASFNHSKSGSGGAVGWGVGFKSNNGQITFTRCSAYNNNKGWDLGDHCQITGCDTNTNMYKVVSSEAYSNNRGVNFVNYGVLDPTPPYTGPDNNHPANFYLINSIIRDNTAFGSHIYSGPYNVYIIHNVYDHNATDGLYEGAHLSITNDMNSSTSDVGRVRVYIYNNIFYNHGTQGKTFAQDWWWLTQSDFNWESDYNAFYQNAAGQGLFAMWGALAGSSESTTYAYGSTEGPGWTTSRWYTEWGASATQPSVAGCVGHHQSDSNSKGTGCQDTTVPIFWDYASHDYRLQNSTLTGLNLSTKPWYISEMGYDRRGSQRTRWDRGVYDNSTGCTLVVTPLDGFFPQGQQGGPFTPSSKTYTLQRSTSDSNCSINWTASTTSQQSWLSAPSALSGTLNSSTPTAQVTVHVDTTVANSLAASTYTGSVAFIDVTNGNATQTDTASLRVGTTECNLSVTPLETFSSTGPVGGPFSPSSKLYTLQNTGGANCSWSVSKGQNWVTLSSPTSGALTPSQSTQVTVSINSQANSLGAGEHDDTVTFTSSGSGGGSVAVVLSIYSPSVYYIDPANGNDSNNGYTTATAWRHLPGSWDQSGSGYLTGSGWKTIQPGDILHIKSGTTISNKLYIDSTWYANGTSSQPIRIIRDTSWGTGQVIFDGTSQVIPDNDAMIFIISRNYIQIDGQGNVGSEAGIKIRKSSKYGLVAQGSDEANKMVGLTLKDMKFQNNGWWNLVLTRQDSFLVENVAVDGYQKDTASSGGIMVGGNPYACSNGTFRNCQSYNNGNTPGTQQGGGARFGFWIMNSTNITLDRCTAYNNEGSGFVISPAGASPTVAWDNIKLTNCLAYNNANGFTTTHYDTASGGNAYFTNCISRNNASKGWAADSGAHATLYNCVASRNGLTGAYLDTSAGVFTTRDTIATIKNSIFYGNTTNSIYAHNCQDLQVVMDYNLFEKGTTGGTTMIQWDDAAGRETYHKVYYFSTNDAQNIIAWRADKGQDAHSYDSVELGKHAYFVSSTDLHLQSTSDAINVGTDLSSVWPSGIATTDMDGHTRPAGSAWDIGAYEYGS